jgi:hypothetical protein
MYSNSTLDGITEVNVDAVRVGLSVYANHLGSILLSGNADKVAVVTDNLCTH